MIIKARRVPEKKKQGINTPVSFFCTYITQVVSYKNTKSQEGLWSGEGNYRGDIVYVNNYGEPEDRYYQYIPWFIWFKFRRRAIALSASNSNLN